jgi:hypothetical protein
LRDDVEGEPGPAFDGLRASPGSFGALDPEVLGEERCVFVVVVEVMGLRTAEVTGTSVSSWTLISPVMTASATQSWR